MVRILTVNSCRVLFWIVIVGGIGLRLGRIRWLGVWIGIEVSLLGVYGVFCGKFTQREVLSSIKYLLIQVLRAGIILIGFLIRDWAVIVNVLGELIVNLGLFMKIGVFPFYYWVIPVMAGLSWGARWLFCTLQKIIPLMAFCVILEFFVFIRDICALIRVIVAGFEGIRQVRMRGIFAYSSIGQRGWLLVLCGRGDSLRVVWFSAIYRFVLITVFWRFFKYDPYSYTFIKINNLRRGAIKVYNRVVILSLLGLPPLFGFIPKVLVLCEVGFRLGLFSLGFLWSVGIRVWFYTSFLFSWLVESYGNLYYLSVHTNDRWASKVLHMCFFSVNLWGGLIYFIL